MIVVTGATGKLGGQVVQQLLHKLPADQVGASVRDPEKAEAMSRRGVRVRQGDFDAPDSLAAALEGATQVLIVSSNARAYGGDPVAQQRAAIEAAGRRARGGSSTPATWARAPAPPSRRCTTTPPPRRC